MVGSMVYGARRAGALGSFALGALAVLLNAAAAQTGGARSVAGVTREQSAAAAEAARLHQEAELAGKEINSLRDRLKSAGSRGEATLEAAAAAENQLAALSRQAEELAAQYKLDREDYEDAVIAAAFAERGAWQVGSQAGVFAAAAAAEFQGRLARRELGLRDVERRVAELGVEKDLLADARAAIEAERESIALLIGRHRAVRTTLTRGAAAAERRAERLASEARSLRELASRTQAQRTRTARRTAGPIPAAWVAPVSGQIVGRFGDRAGSGARAEGATLRTAPGARVVAPGAGVIAYARLFRSYGQVLILNLDGGYAVVLTGLETVNAQEGEAVTSGQLLGLMPAGAATAPDLYVEVRRDGRSIDPARWLGARGLVAEASGRAG
jgi:murein hydrolase activator